MAIQFQIDVSPDPIVLSGVMDEVSTRARTINYALEQVVQTIFIRELESNFDAEGRPSSWPQLAETTIKIRNDQGFGSGPILDRTGALRGNATSLSAWSFGGGGDQYVAELMDVTDYGGYHIKGGPMIPQRDWTYLSDAAGDAAVQVFQDWVMEPF
jgi:phage gpG-like protein